LKVVKWAVGQKKMAPREYKVRPIKIVVLYPRRLRTSAAIGEKRK
jgi:hypothetical protein